MACASVPAAVGLSALSRVCGMAFLVLEKAYVHVRAALLCVPLQVLAMQSKADNTSSGHEGLIQVMSYEIVEMLISVLQSLQEGPEGGMGKRSGELAYGVCSPDVPLLNVI